MFYRVSAKCGHVGKSNYILKDFYVRAISGKDAARKIRNAPRVKHHHKDAIRVVEKIDYNEYINGVKEMCDDCYFHVHNSSDQKRMVSGLILYKEEIVEEKITKNIEYKLKKNKIKEMEARKLILGAIYG